MINKFEKKSGIFFLTILCFLCLFGLISAHILVEHQAYSLWSDRDLMRAYFIKDNFQYFGAELTGGGRVFG